MNKPIDKGIIPLSISILLILISIGITMFSDNILNHKHYLAIPLILLCIVLYFKNSKSYVYVFLLTLILGIIDIIDIFYLHIEFKSGIIKFNPIFLVLTIMFIALNKELLNRMFPEKQTNKGE